MAKNMVYNAINREEYEKISSRETAKEMWDKLEVTYEGTNKVKETRINLLVRDYELFQMKDGESIEEMFSRFRKILGDLKSFGRQIKSGEQVRKILRGLPTIWQPKVIVLECQDLDKISNDELRGDLIVFEKTRLDRQIQQEKKKTFDFKATMTKPENEEEEERGEQDENIAMLSKVVTNMMRKKRNSRRGKSNFRKSRMNNDNDKNDGSFYECGKHRHTQAECPELKKKLSKNFQKKKSFGAWSDEEEYDHQEITNMYFMAIKEDNNEDLWDLGLMADEGIGEEEDLGELGLMTDEGTSEVRLPTCLNYYELQEFVDIALVDIQRVLNEPKKVKREKTDWALKLEICEIERDMLQDKIDELQLQLKGLRKSTSHSSIRSNQITPHTPLIRTRNSTTCTSCDKIITTLTNAGIESEQKKTLKIPIIFLVFIVDNLATLLTIAGSRTTGDGFGDLNLLVKIILRALTIQDPSRLGLVTKLDGGIVTFGDKSKGNVNGVGRVPLTSTYDVDEVYLVDELDYNLLSISQLCNNDYEVHFKKYGWFTENESGKVILSRNRDRNVYTISNLDSFGNQICLASIIDDLWVWHRKLGHASMHTIHKRFKNDLVIGLPKVDFSKDQICDACQLGKQTRSSFKAKDIVSTTKPLQILHMDLFGPTRTASIGCRKYAFVRVDDFSRFIRVIFLSHKDEALRNFEVFSKKVQLEKGLRFMLTGA
uniref:Integrase catalytic domain-containing protein n=1 Tax=Nicotiana tabacum TaxID=4097 RepID=A0A1S4BZQ4_TOBAC